MTSANNINLPVIAEVRDPGDLVVPTGALKIVAGVLRNNAGAWQWISGAHHSAGAEFTVTTGSTGLIVDFSDVWDAVVTFLVGPDEALATQDGVIAGASVQTDKAIIQMSTHASRVAGTGLINPATLTNPSGNLWIFGLGYVTA